jgi:hypothetical protein
MYSSITHEVSRRRGDSPALRRDRARTVVPNQGIASAKATSERPKRTAFSNYARVIARWFFTEATCYWFHTPNAAAVMINKWVSDMTPGSHHMIFFDGGPERIAMNNECGFSSRSGSSHHKLHMKWPAIDRARAIAPSKDAETSLRATFLASRYGPVPWLAAMQFPPIWT